MANYLYMSLFFCDETLARTSGFSEQEICALHESKRPCFRASSRHGDSADRIAAILAAKGSDHSHLDFIASKGKWPYELWADVLPFDELLPIAESIDDLLAWSARSIPVLTRILDNDSAEEIADALQAPAISANPNDGSGVDFDGYGARFLFSFLASIASIAREAHASQRALIFFRG